MIDDAIALAACIAVELDKKDWITSRLTRAVMQSVIGHLMALKAEHARRGDVEDIPF